MKKIFTLLLILNSAFCILNSAFAQAPQAIPYQAVARDNAGNLIANQIISLRFSIHAVTAGGTVVYKETQNTTTNALGLFTVNAGQGTPVTGTFASISWAINAKFMQVEMDASGGTTYVDMGTQQMMSVPYALYAENSASTGIPLIQGSNDTIYSIPDNSCTGITSNITLSGLPASPRATANFAVTINITHTFDGDLHIFLIAPDGSVLSLARALGSSGDNFTNTTFSDSGVTNISTGSAPFTGIFKPHGLLTARCSITPTVATFSAIGGGSINPNGTWTLKIFDQVGSDAGTLNSWSISNGGSVPNYIPKWLSSGQLSSTGSIYDNGNNIIPNVGIGTAGTPASSAVLELKSSDKGLLIPRMTTNQRNAIANPATGLQIFNADNQCINIYDGSNWIETCGLKVTGTTSSSDNWQSKANFGGTARYGAVAFSIGNKGYIGTGYDGSYKNDFWEFDPSTNAWTQKANFGGAARFSAVAFSIGTKGYIGTGYDGSYKNDFWEFGPTPIYSTPALSGASVSVDYGAWTLAGTTVYNSNTGNVGIGTSSPVAKLNIEGIGSATELFRVSNDKNTTVDSVMVFTSSGNVGIGTASPLDKLHVVGSIRMADGNQGLNKTMVSDVNGKATWQTLATAQTNAWGLTGNAGISAVSNFIGTSDNISLRFRTNNIERTIIDSVGNVGIGTTVPTSKLHVQGSIKGFDSYLGSPTGAYGISIGSSGGGYGSLGYGLTYTATTGSYQYRNSDFSSMLQFNLGGFDFNTSPSGIAGNGITYTTAMKIMQSGNVGIGITSPLTTLQIGGAGEYGLQKGDVAPNAGYLRFGDNTGWKFHIGRLRESAGGAVNTTTTGVVMTVLDNGNVGIGCTSPQYKLHVIGDIAAQGGTLRAASATVSTTITACSDIRFKKNITPLANSLDKVLKLQGVNYFWKTKEFPDRYFNDKRQIGLIAQEVEKIFPELVLTDTDGYKSVDYSKLTPILVEAIKELKAENDLLKADNKSFKSDIQMIKAQLGMDVKAEK